MGFANTLLRKSGGGGGPGSGNGAGPANASTALGFGSAWNAKTGSGRLAGLIAPSSSALGGLASGGSILSHSRCVFMYLATAAC